MVSRCGPLDQMFEGLVTLEPGTTEVIPGLAKSWEVSEDGLTYTFTLEEGVTFHDGERVQRRSRLLQLRALVQLQGLVPERGRQLLLADGLRLRSLRRRPGVDSLYEGCTATDDTTVELKITKPSSSILARAGTSELHIQSPPHWRSSTRTRAKSTPTASSARPARTRPSTRRGPVLTCSSRGSRAAS